MTADAAAEASAGGAPALLVADDVVAGYLPGIDILRGCSLTVHEGELVGIIGPNGAGKSTLLKAAFGLVPVRSGRVTLRSDDITRCQAHELVGRGVGYVPQTNNVFSSLTIEDNLWMGAYLRPHAFDERFAAMGELFPMLVERRKERAGLLSGGQRHRTAPPTPDAPGPAGAAGPVAGS